MATSRSKDEDWNGIPSAERRVRILGLDPGFSSIGWAIIHAGKGNEIIQCTEAGVIRTKPDNGNKNASNVRRIMEISKALNKLVTTHKVHVVGCEAMSWTRFSNADRAVAFFWGALGAVLANKTAITSLEQITPVQVKELLTGNKKASKEDVHDAACKKVEGLRHQLGKIGAKTQRNHASDAAAVAYCTLTSTASGQIAASMRDDRAHFDFEHQGPPPGRRSWE